MPDAATWDHPAPVAGWTARDVVRHLLDWFPGFLQAGAGTTLPAGPSPDDDPVAAWTTFKDGVQAMLDDPASQDRTFTNPHTGSLSLSLPLPISRFFTADLFMHTWDLARATGQNETLGPRALRVDARGHGANGGSTARERAVRTARRSP